MTIDFSQMSQEQKRNLLQHLEDFKNNPRLMEGEDENELENISSAIGTGGSTNNDHMLAVCIANTYVGDWFQCLRSLGLPQDLI